MNASSDAAVAAALDRHRARQLAEAERAEAERVAADHAFTQGLMDAIPAGQGLDPASASLRDFSRELADAEAALARGAERLQVLPAEIADAERALAEATAALEAARAAEREATVALRAVSPPDPTNLGWVVERDPAYKRAQAALAKAEEARERAGAAWGAAKGKLGRLKAERRSHLAAEAGLRAVAARASSRIGRLEAALGPVRSAAAREAPPAPTLTFPRHRVS